MEKENISRNQMHEKLMICTYQYVFFLAIQEKQDLNTIITTAFANNPSMNDPFVKKYMISLIKNFFEMVECVNPLLKEGWEFDNLGMMERSCLLLGINNIKYLDTPKPVAINIAVKLAKEYCDDNSYKLINAVLQKI